jgi:hypothetical protein
MVPPLFMGIQKNGNRLSDINLADEEEKQAIKLLRGKKVGSLASEKVAHLTAMVRKTCKAYFQSS